MKSQEGIKVQQERSREVPKQNQTCQALVELGPPTSFGDVHP